MTRNDIMNLAVGDWVMVAHLDGFGAAKIESLDLYGEINVKNSQINQFEAGYDCYVSDIDGLPITDEILEKNGFVFREDDGPMYGEYYLHNQSTFAIKMFNGRLVGMCMGEDLEFDYVHELQHVLRLCRLNDLADNFQII